MKVEAPSAEELAEEPGFFCSTLLVEVVCVCVVEVVCVCGGGGVCAWWRRCVCVGEAVCVRGGVCAPHLVVDAIYFCTGAAECVLVSPSVVHRNLPLSRTSEALRTPGSCCGSVSSETRWCCWTWAENRAGGCGQGGASPSTPSHLSCMFLCLCWNFLCKAL